MQQILRQLFAVSELLPLIVLNGLLQHLTDAAEFFRKTGRNRCVLWAVSGDEKTKGKLQNII